MHAEKRLGVRLTIVRACLVPEQRASTRSNVANAGLGNRHAGGDGYG